MERAGECKVLGQTRNSDLTVGSMLCLGYFIERDGMGISIDHSEKNLDFVINKVSPNNNE